jgi:isoamylase
VEGETSDPAVERLRQRQIKNVLTILCVSQGTPMLWAGDEVRRTQCGNNNAYCQDNEISWFDWDLLERHSDIYRFCRGLIRLRRAHPTLHKKRVFECAANLFGSESSTVGDALISWHGLFVCQPDWSDASRSLAFTLRGVDGDASFYVILNAYWEELSFELPVPPDQGTWLRVVDTSLKPPDALAEPGTEIPLSRGVYRAGPRSAVVLMSAE